MKLTCRLFRSHSRLPMASDSELKALREKYVSKLSKAEKELDYYKSVIGRWSDEVFVKRAELVTFDLIQVLGGLVRFSSSARDKLKTDKLREYAERRRDARR